MEREFNLRPLQRLGYPSEVADGYLALHTVRLLDIIHVLSCDDDQALLVPPEHIDLIDLVRKQQSL